MASLDFTRRAVIAGAAALAAVPSTFATTPEEEAPIAPLPQARDRVKTFLSSLDENQRERTRFELGSSTWHNWNYFGGRLIKPGLPMKDMSDEQQIAALDLLSSVFSPTGMEKADRVMHLQDVLAARGDPRRSSENFSFAVFGVPGPTTPWAFRFEGHHLTMTATFRGDDLIAVTPSSFSCNPNEVTSGDHRGMIALTDEEMLARTLQADLKSAARHHAQIDERAYRNIMTSAGREQSLITPEGLPASDLTSGQTDLLFALIETYAVDHLAFDIADNQRARIRTGDSNAIRFAWAGGNEKGTPFYYRLTGETFLIELATVDRQAQHLHTIYHDLERNLGGHVLAG
ncbi:MAG: DUF3500 domain-containing protein [Pseudomonadota bacterium]